MIVACARRLFGFVALVAGMAAGPPPAPEPKNVKVTLVCILACEKAPPHVDPELIHIAAEIQKKKPEFKCFKVACMGCKSLAVNDSHTFTIVDDQKVTVVVKQAADKNNLVVLDVQPPLQGRFEYETVCGKFLPIITRYETKSGQRLIIAICAKPCNGGK